VRISKRTAGRVAALAAGVAAAASVAAAVSATAFARTTPAPAAGPACQARALTLRLAGTDTGVGTTALTVAITSHATKACVVGGYPSLGLLRADGAPQPAMFSHGRGTWFAGLPDRAVRLAPGGQASFFITYRDFNPATGHAGPAVTALRAALPGVPGRFTVPARFAPYGGISVSPIRAGARKE
jgi:hypothetical protein